MNHNDASMSSNGHFWSPNCRPEAAPTETHGMPFDDPTHRSANLLQSIMMWWAKSDDQLRWICLGLWVYDFCCFWSSWNLSDISRGVGVIDLSLYIRRLRPAAWLELLGDGPRRDGRQDSLFHVLLFHKFVLIEDIKADSSSFPRFISLMIFEYG